MPENDIITAEVVCVQKIENITKSYEDSAYMMSLGGNHNVTRTVAKLTVSGEGRLLVKYAQNGILSDLIYFGECDINGFGEIEVLPENPVSASHIYLFVPEGVNIADADVYEMPTFEGAECYPAYKDIDLGENYYLDSVAVFTGEDGYSHYTVYTSMDGGDFEFLASKSDESICDMHTGDVYDANGREARIIRVYIEYNSASMEAVLRDVKFEGTKSGTPIKHRRQIDIEAFEDSSYNVAVSEQDTYDEVYGIISRRIGDRYKSWFELCLAPNPKKGHTYDYFELTNKDGKICIMGNNGVSLAVGLNHYLKYYCKVNISQVGDQPKMPAQVVGLKAPVFKETKARVRYSYNYCTLSYSMAFWGRDEWRAELDWLALNGVNVVLDATAQEEVWRRFLSKLGYTHDEVKKYIAGPAYYAWAYMANMFGYGGPVHDSWFEKRTMLARENHLIMRKLGMYPVLQGYSGMVPVDILEHDQDAEVIPQGTWCSFVRPYMLVTTSPAFRKYAAVFYEAQKEVYGTYSKYFATDPFHEGGNTADMSPRSISAEVLGAMLRANPDSVWIIQSWQHNPSSELLKGLESIENGKEHALVLDLYAEKKPNYPKGGEGKEAFGYSKEFDHTPWIFCMLNNFGGRLGLHGHLDNMASWIPKAYNTCSKIAGIGITPEASGNNPVLYDFLFECIWQDDADDEMKEVDLGEWLCEYAHRRYGVWSVSANKAWEILKDTVYKAELNNLGQGAPESVLNARPSLRVSAASTWGNAVVSYDKNKLKEAARLLLADYDIMHGSEGYIYDLTTVLQQVLSNTAQDLYDEMTADYKNGDAQKFRYSSARFLKIADNMEAVTSTSKYYMLGRWVEQAKSLANDADDMSKKLYEFNAKALITTWGAYNQAEIGQLHDYSNRQWSGLIGDYYKPRWERWIRARTNELENKPYEKKINWFEWEWKWARQNTVYATEPVKADLKKLGYEIIGEI